MFTPSPVYRVCWATETVPSVPKEYKSENKNFHGHVSVIAPVYLCWTVYLFESNGSRKYMQM